MPNTKFKDLGYNFKIVAVDSIPTELRNEFKDELSETDKELIEYFFNLKLNDKLEYLISIEEHIIGYCSIHVDESYWNLYEIYIKKEFRELGIGTKLFETINNDSKKDNKQIRTYTLPSDRTAKNFYESNRITARVLIMEQKRATSRYKI